MKKRIVKRNYILFGIVLVLVLIVGNVWMVVGSPPATTPPPFDANEPSTWIAQNPFTGLQLAQIKAKLAEAGFDINIKLNSMTSPDDRNKLYKILNEYLTWGDEFNAVFNKLNDKHLLELWAQVPDAINKNNKKWSHKEFWEGLTNENKAKLWKSFDFDKEKASTLKENLIRALDDKGKNELFNQVLNGDDEVLRKEKNFVATFLLRESLSSYKDGGKQKYSAEDLKNLEMKGLEDKNIKLDSANKLIGILGPDNKVVDGFSLENNWLRKVEYSSGNFKEQYDSQLDTNMRTVVHAKGIVDKDGNYNRVNVLYGHGGTVTITTSKEGEDTYAISESKSENPVAILVNGVIITGTSFTFKSAADGKVNLVGSKGAAQAWFNVEYKDSTNPKQATSYGYLNLADEGGVITDKPEIYEGATKGVLISTDKGATVIGLKGVKGVDIVAGGNVGEISDIKIVSEGSTEVKVARFSDGKVHVLIEGSLVKYPFEGGISGFVSPDLNVQSAGPGGEDGTGAGDGSGEGSGSGPGDGFGPVREGSASNPAVGGAGAGAVGGGGQLSPDVQKVQQQLKAQKKAQEINSANRGSGILIPSANQPNANQYVKSMTGIDFEKLGYTLQKVSCAGSAGCYYQLSPPGN